MHGDGGWVSGCLAIRRCMGGEMGRKECMGHKETS